jgi:hypothetical protein
MRPSFPYAGQRSKRTWPFDSRSKRMLSRKSTRHFGSVDHLHGGGAAFHGRCQCRSPGFHRQPRAASRQADVFDAETDLTLALGEAPIEHGNLASALDADTQGDKEQRVFVRADRVVPYGEVMELMNLLRGAGYLKIGLVGMEAAPGGPAAPGEPALGAAEPNSSESKPVETKP